jgi:SAM-dependent methyltransferase
MIESRKFDEESQVFGVNGNIHDLPNIAHWFSEEILSGQLLTHTGSKSYEELILKSIKDLRKIDEILVLVSLGAGHGQMESELLKKVAIFSPGDTHFYSIDLFSPNDTTETVIDGKKYTLTRISQDLNNAAFPENAKLIIVSHALHHFLALEEIFESICRILLCNSGYLVISDIVGRNGHMRWHESLRAIRRIWSALPIEKRYNHQLDAIWQSFENWDCSREGFEGIRSEDILKLLFAYFEVDGAYFWGGISDPFIDRGFGHNFNPSDSRDIETIKKILTVESILTEYGYVTPTQVIGRFRPRSNPLVPAITNLLASKKYFDGLRLGVRQRIDDTVDRFFEATSTNSELVILNKVYKNWELKPYANFGWDCSDPTLMWAVGLDSKLTFRFNDVSLACVQLEIHALESAKFGQVRTLINGEVLITQPISPIFTIHLPSILIYNIEIEFSFEKIESLIESPDKRALSLFISKVIFYEKDVPMKKIEAFLNQIKTFLRRSLRI